MKLFCSYIYLLLSNFTGLKLHFLALSKDETEHTKKRQKLLLRLLALKKILAVVSQSQKPSKWPAEVPPSGEHSTQGKTKQRIKCSHLPWRTEVLEIWSLHFNNLQHQNQICPQFIFLLWF